MGVPLRRAVSEYEAIAAIAEAVRPLPVGTEAVDWEQARDRHPARPVLHATLAGKIHDYLDPGPVFRKMHSKRLATYATLGFDVPTRR